MTYVAAMQLTIVTVILTLPQLDQIQMKATIHSFTGIFKIKLPIQEEEEKYPLSTFM